MFQERVILIATLLVLRAGAAGAETAVQSVSNKASSLEIIVPQPSSPPTPLPPTDASEPDQSAGSPSDDPQQSSIAEGWESLQLDAIYWPNTLVDAGEPMTTWTDGLLTEESELLGPKRDCEVQSAIYSADRSTADNFSNFSPRSFRNYRSRTDPPLGLVLRGGLWNTSVDGSKTKIGEYQSLQPSGFWDADGLYTDGHKTIDFSATGLDSEGTDASLDYFGPRVSADVEYQRFLRRLDHDPLDGITDSQHQPPGGIIITKDDLNAGEDYAIRVQELKAKFKGDLSKNLKWRLGIWGMRKRGERQVNAMGHCFNNPDDADINGNPVPGVSCHVLTQRQRIDWITTEIEPALEATLGSATVEYARTMRAFDQSDEVTTRSYDNSGGFFGGDRPYAVVPENFTEIDRIKSNVLLLPNWDVYSSYYTGNTKNKFRNANRRLWGFDLRTTVRRGARASLTGFAKKNVQTGQIPAVLLPEENIADLHAPINYDQSIAGIKGRWRPFYGDCSWRHGLRLSGGYEYRGLARENAIFSEDAVTVDQSQTTANMGNVRASMKWNSAIESHVRYRLGLVDDPLFGIAKNGEINTGLPTHEHLVEIGGTWTPVDNFLLTGTFGFEDRSNNSRVANFQENDYPIVVTAWYAPEPRWIFSGGLALFSNGIDQDVTLGALSDPITSSWNYRGRSDEINLGTTYVWNDRLTLSAGFAFVRGSNRFTTPATTPDLSPFSEVLVETTRWTSGLDYQLSSRSDFYFRYQFFDYDDKAQEFNSGTANMFLTGINAVF
ncbi:hypothetical protein OAS39_06940 [Pirellulales bacterium]|nr:hypothetical protein [Pirellulales bacterium]